MNVLFFLTPVITSSPQNRSSKNIFWKILAYGLVFGVLPYDCRQKYLISYQHEILVMKFMATQLKNFECAQPQNPKQEFVNTQNKIITFQPSVSYYSNILFPVSVKFENRQSQKLIPEFLMNRAIYNLNSPKQNASQVLVTMIYTPYMCFAKIHDLISNTCLPDDIEIKC